MHRIEGGLWTAGAAYGAAAGRFYASGGGIEEIAAIDAAGALPTGDTAEEGAETSQHFLVNLTIDAEGQRLFAADALCGQAAHSLADASEQAGGQRGRPDPVFDRQDPA
ncbi:MULTISPECIES: hypothetical protein [Paracoccus]|uniref:hypothetical protein n=1 Tax=Paracoccus TaxID=265 RepID=UPI00051D174F|nr:MULTISPECIES: hypothetical protein [Paracoccus]KGJ11085.1 hypothetical protein IT40_08810 [Paracoccus versutus]